MIAIVAVGYNRPNSMRRLLDSLVVADYLEDKVDLIISIDKSDNQSLVIAEAEKTVWNHGERIIRPFSERQGLRSHILQCGDYSQNYDAVVVLEDDLIVSRAFYKYVKACIEKYDSCQEIAGISLYSYTVNEFCGERFVPASNGYDVYMMQIAQSWGECWTKRMWNSFRSWVDSDQELLEKGTYMPEKVFGWGKSSWKKNYMAYLARENKYFVYPYYSYSTNFVDVGTHNKKILNDFQVPLVEDKSEWLFPSFEKAIKYDTFFERIDIENIFSCLNNLNVCMDLYGLKTEYNGADILYSRRQLPFRVINRIGLVLRPIEMNCVSLPGGNAIYEYDLKTPSSPPKNQDGDFEWYEYNTVSANWRFCGRYWWHGFINAIKQRLF